MNERFYTANVVSRYARIILTQRFFLAESGDHAKRQAIVWASREWPEAGEVTVHLSSEDEVRDYLGFPRACPHGFVFDECQSCMVAADLEYDARRENP